MLKRQRTKQIIFKKAAEQAEEAVGFAEMTLGESEHGCAACRDLAEETPLHWVLLSPWVGMACEMEGVCVYAYIWPV